MIPASRCWARGGRWLAATPSAMMIPTAHQPAAARPRPWHTRLSVVQFPAHPVHPLHTRGSVPHQAALSAVRQGSLVSANPHPPASARLGILGAAPRRRATSGAPFRAVIAPAALPLRNDGLNVEKLCRCEPATFWKILGPSEPPCALQSGGNLPWCFTISTRCRFTSSSTPFPMVRPRTTFACGHTPPAANRCKRAIRGGSSWLSQRAAAERPNEG
jgi:hypothetical protein